ncbi:MAG TPA: hypothetical protein VF202_12240 [Trueperaceae bacterium]
MNCLRCKRPLPTGAKWDDLLCKPCQREEREKLLKSLLPWERMRRKKR